MNITTSQNGAASAVQVALSGRFDAHEAPAFRELIDGAMADGATTFHVSLEAVEFVDSTALAELIRGMKHCRQEGGDLILVEPSPPVRVILELTKLDAAFTIR